MTKAFTPILSGLRGQPGFSAPTAHKARLLVGIIHERRACAAPRCWNICPERAEDNSRGHRPRNSLHNSHDLARRGRSPPGPGHATPYSSPAGEPLNTRFAEVVAAPGCGKLHLKRGDRLPPARKTATVAARAGIPLLRVATPDIRCLPEVARAAGCAWFQNEFSDAVRNYPGLYYKAFAEQSLPARQLRIGG